MISEELIQQFIKETELFEERLRAFEAGEIDRKTFKGISGRFGCYAQREKNYMLRLRFPGGRISKEHLAFLGEKTREYPLELMKITTCQTIQVHNLTPSQVVSLMREALQKGIITIGGGGDNPRNVMSSPLSGADSREAFDVLPYAETVSDYLISRMTELHLPRKLKVAFSNTEENTTHANMRDLGFTANPEGTFSVYCAGGLGPNPKMGVLVEKNGKPQEVSLYVSAMIRLFTKYGDYKNRGKSRSRYLQDTLGEEGIKKEYLCCLEEARKEEIPWPVFYSHPTLKSGDEEIEGSRIFPQKQPGLYAVSYHPIGGCLTQKNLMVLCEVLRNIPDTELRLSPDGTIYILHLTAKEVPRILEATGSGGENLFETSTSCIGVPICQRGIGCSQWLLAHCIERVRKENFPDGLLPRIHISGCPSGCGTHQAASLGFMGCKKKVEGETLPAFRLFINGQAKKPGSRIGEEAGILPEEVIPEFLVELGRDIQKSHKSFEEWLPENKDRFLELVREFEGAAKLIR